MTQLEITELPGKSEVKLLLTGSITENCSTILRPHLQSAGTKSLVFDLSGVTIVNSTGIAEWIKVVGPISEKRRVTLTRCPPTIITVLNMVPSFLGNAEVYDLFVDLHCPACDVEQRVLVEVSDRDEQLNMNCDQCGQPMDMVLNPEDVFSFAEEDEA